MPTLKWCEAAYSKGTIIEDSFLIALRRKKAFSRDNGLMRSWDRIAVAGEITLLGGSDFFDSAGECNFGSVTSPFLSDPMLLQAFPRHAIEIDSVSPGEMSADPNLKGERDLIRR